VVPVETADRHRLAATLRSALGDGHETPVELCVAPVGPVGLDADIASDRRVSICPPQPALATATRAALAAARGDAVALLSPGDLLVPGALGRARNAWQHGASAVDVLYTDEAERGDRDQPVDPFLKPDWSPERLHAQPYLGRFTALRRRLVEEVGGLRSDLGEAAEHDLVLRVAERARRVHHLTGVAYLHAPDRPAIPAPSPAGLRAITEHLERTGFPATAEIASEIGAEPDADAYYRLRPALRERPLVSIVIPTAGYRRYVRGALVDLVVHCVRSVVTRSTYPDYEIVCVAGDAMPARTRDALTSIAGDRLCMVDNPGTFNFARAINLGALHSQGQHLVLLNDDTEVITPDWIEALLMFSTRPDVGAVGAKLLFADDRVQHGGIIVPSRGGPGHPWYGFPGDHPGYADALRVPCEYQAVTGACLMTRREHFDAVGGFATVFPLNYNDVDYCLKLRQRGQAVVVNPQVRLYHFEWSSRGEGTPNTAELAELERRWGTTLDRDPFYNEGFGRSCDFRPPVTSLADARRTAVRPWSPGRAPALP